MQMVVTKPDWAKKIVFKHEGEVDGMIIGPAFFDSRPVTVFDLGKGKMRPLRKDADGCTEWFTLRDTRKIAEGMKLPVEEV